MYEEKFSSLPQSLWQFNQGQAGAGVTAENRSEFYGTAVVEGGACYNAVSDNLQR